jgi:uncharacterized membrane protein YqgA involved in biofilm formation
MIPIGIFFNTGCIVLGSLIGATFGKFLPEKTSKILPSIFGIAALCMGVSLITNVNSLTAVVLALILGSIIGESLGLETGLSRLLSKMFANNTDNNISNNNNVSTLISIIVLFGFSGTGIFGALNAGFSGDHSIIIAKSFLDFFTAIIFGTTVGYVIIIAAIPQTAISLMLFYSSSILLPFLTNYMISDFKALGGIVTFTVGLKMLDVKHFNVINLLPALILVMPFSYLWSLLPL